MGIGTNDLEAIPQGFCLVESQKIVEGILRIIYEDPSRIFVSRISQSKVKDALRKMEVRKAMEPDSTPIEDGKSLCDLGLTWLTRLLNKILKTKDIK